MSDRKGFIGGSDIAAVMGLSRWKTCLQLWAEKTGKLDPADLSEVEAVQLGSELEDFVAKKFSKETGLKVRRAPKIYSHKEFPHFRCQVDRLVVNEKHVHSVDALLECKTTSAWKAKEWEGEEIPIEYILQVQWQLGITRRQEGWVAVLIGGQSFKYKKIDFDQELFDKMILAAKKFWQMIQDDEAPMAMGDDNYIIVDLFPQETGDSVQYIEEFNDRIGLLQQLKGNIAAMVEQKDEIEAQIKQVIADNLGIRTSEYKCIWKRQERKQYVVPASQTRVLRITKEKENEKGAQVGNR